MLRTVTSACNRRRYSLHWERGRDPATNLDNLTVQSITNLLELLATLTEEAQAIAECLASLREELSDDQWDAVDESPLGDLLNACCDLESTIEQLS